jgi:membrane-associated phospholipid phosphatase
VRYHAGTLAILASAALAAGCGEANTAPSGAETGGSEVAYSAVKFWEVGASAGWNQIATSLAARRPIDAGRLYAYLSMAQFRAAEAGAAIHPNSPTSAAIGAASAAVLSSFFPLDIAEIEAALDAQEAASPWPGAVHQDFASGEAMGRAVGAKVLVFASGDRVGLADPGTPPIGPGYWLWSGGPIARGGYRARPFFLASDSEFRPSPPPAFGSPDYLAALAEVRSISDTRTAEQLAIAVYWNLNQSPRSDAAMENLAVELIRAHHVQDAAAAKILFLMNAASFDAIIGCFDAKYAYWFIRPPQADPAITLPIGLPPHPSYPSAHSCVSGAMTGVLAAAFPSETARLARVAEEASLSRLYGGIHYRFDMQAGLALGAAVAAKAVAADPRLRFFD